MIHVNSTNNLAEEIQMNTTIAKTYGRRDSATAFLRGNGINREHYDLFIAKQPDGTFIVDLKKVEDHKAQAANRRATDEPAKKEDEAKSPKPETKPAKKSTKKTSKIVIEGEKRTVSSVARALIMNKKSNAEVWAALKAEFELDDSKKHYPAWYRSELKRSGKLV